MSYKDVVFTESQIEGVKKGRGQLLESVKRDSTHFETNNLKSYWQPWKPGPEIVPTKQP